MKKTLLTVAASIAAFTVTASASASTFQIESISALHNGPVGDVALAGTTHNGSFSPQTISGIWNGELVSFLAYCLELTQYSAAGTFNVVSLTDYVTDTNRAGNIAALVSTYAGSGLLANDAALQLALWEARYEDGNFDMAGGTLKLESVSGLNQSDLTSRSNSYLAQMGTVDSNRQFWVATNDSHQDLLFYTVKPAVPEPATWAMMIIGFASIGRAMRGRRQNTAVSFA